MRPTCRAAANPRPRCLRPRSPTTLRGLPTCSIRCASASSMSPATRRGSLIAAELALLRPDAVRRVVLVGVPVFDARERESFNSRPCPARAREDGSHLVEEWQRSRRSRGPHATLAQFTDDLAAVLRAGDESSWSLAAAANYAAGERLPLLRQPVMILRPRDECWDMTARTDAARDARRSTCRSTTAACSTSPRASSRATHGISRLKPYDAGASVSPRVRAEKTDRQAGGEPLDGVHARARQLAGRRSYAVTRRPAARHLPSTAARMPRRAQSTMCSRARSVPSLPRIMRRARRRPRHARRRPRAVAAASRAALAAAR